MLLNGNMQEKTKKFAKKRRIGQKFSCKDILFQTEEEIMNNIFRIIKATSSHLTYSRLANVVFNYRTS